MIMTEMRMEYTKEVLEEDMGADAIVDMEEEVEAPPTYFNCFEIGHVSRFCTKLCLLCAHFYSHKHVSVDYINLLNKWEDIKQ